MNGLRRNRVLHCRPLRCCVVILFALTGCGDRAGSVETTSSTTDRASGSTNDAGPDPSVARAEESFQKLVAAHRNEDPDAWERAWKEATELFPTLGDPGVAALNNALKENDPVVRELAVTLLAASGADTEAAAAGLLAALKDEAALVRVNAASALSHSSRHAGQVVEALDSLLADDSEVVRSTAVHALANVGKAVDDAAFEEYRIVTRISERLKDSSAEVRHAAAEALAFLGPKGAPAVPALEAAKLDGDDSVRSAAASAIEKIRATPEGDKEAASTEKK